MFHTNTQRMNLDEKKKDATLNDLSTDLSGELYKINTDDKIPNNYRYTLTTIQAAQNQKQTQEI